MKNKIFIDCGFYKGIGTSLFRRTEDYTPDFVFYGFDASILDIKSAQSKHKDVILSNNAVWTYDGKLKFYLSSRRRGQANGVFHNASAKREKEIEVPCIDFGKWIINNFKKDDFIVLKMDIEGSEFEVLQSMINDGSIRYIDIAYIEFHHKRDPYKQIREQLNKVGDLRVRSKIEGCFRKYLK